MNPKAVLEFAAANNVKMVDLRFTDLPGLWHHVSYPIHELDEASFEEGFGMDGSSIRGWAAIHESDMLLVPDPTWYMLDPFTDTPTLVMIGDIVDPVTKQHYVRDPRHVAKKAETYLAYTGIADKAYFGAEAEFFIFDNIRFDQAQQHGYYFIDAEEGRWNSGRERDNLGYRPRYKEGYFPVPAHRPLPGPAQRDGPDYGEGRARHRMPSPRGGHGRAGGNRPALQLHGEVGGWHDDLQVHHPQRCPPVRQDGHLHAQAHLPGQWLRHAHVTRACGRTASRSLPATAMPGLSQMALHYIGGLLKHSPALAALIAPTTNSYKRLVPGFEAPVNLAYSRRNRSAACRIPMYSASPKAKRVEYRPPDPSCNPYLAFAAMLMAGLDGVENKIDPGEPLDKDIYDLGPEEMKAVPSMPGSLEESLRALEKDHDFLLKGDVFSEELIETWVEYKMKNEVQAINTRPHPYEFALYYDI